MFRAQWKIQPSGAKTRKEQRLSVYYYAAEIGRMKLLSLRLQNFRNYQDYIFEPDGLTIIIGPNGIGKTNILEAIRFLSLYKSFRAKKQADLTRWGQDYFRLEARYQRQSQKEKKMEVYQDKTQKVGKLNGVKQNLAQMVGELKTVLFAPDDLLIIGGAPALRRRWLDMTLAQKNKKYLRNLVKYYQVMKHRNQVVMRVANHISQKGELDFWDEQLLALGKNIREQREAMIGEFNQHLGAEYKKISGKDQVLLIKTKFRKFDKEHLEESLLADLKLGSTTLGPHHDDLMLDLAGRDIGAFGSRGEYRSAVLALKIAEANFLSIGDDRPVVLLDDIMSELDENRRHRLFKLFSQDQVILTTADTAGIEKKVLKKAKIIKL